MIKLRCGNTNTFYIPGAKCGLLIDTDWAGTLPLFFKAIKSTGLGISDISYVLASIFVQRKHWPLAAIRSKSRSSVKLRIIIP